ncbi:MAG: two-component regulator propeller domain-containing protein [Chitinophagaceae bacterium]
MTITLCTSVVENFAYAQKYNFTNYNVEQGLAQSQAQDIVQDHNGFLWIATLGGVSRFDGVSFKNYSKADGLLSLLDFTIHPGNNGKIWIGTQDGIQCYSGRNFETLRFTDSIKPVQFTTIQESVEGGVYCIAKNRLYQSFDGRNISRVKQFANYYTTVLSADRNKNIYAAVYKKGIYRLNDGQWTLSFDLNKFDSSMIVYRLCFTGENQYLLSNKGLFAIKNDSLLPVLSREKLQPEFICIEQDAKGRLWIGTTHGVLVINTGSVEAIGASEGLTDNSVLRITKDREANLWFATDGGGIFKLTDNPLSCYNSAHGMKGNVVMSVVKEATDKIWIGTMDGGLQIFNGKKFTPVTIPGAGAEARKINALLLDSFKQLWIGTIGGGLWKMADGKFSEILVANGLHFKEIVAIYEDSQRQIWACTGSGVYYYEQGTMHKIQGIDQPCFTIYEQGKDSMLAGTSKGLWRILNKSIVKKVEISGDEAMTVNCILKWKNYFLLGTEDAGIIFWQPITGKSMHCSSRNGLTSDFIFSLFADGDNQIFAGTGHGISKIYLTADSSSFTVRNYSFFNNPYGPECNLNAVQKIERNKICFGTTRGLVIYNPDDSALTSKSPLVYLKNVSLFSNRLDSSLARDTFIAWQPIPVNLNLTHDQNQLTFEFTGLYFSNPLDIRYSYKLEGLDTSYSGPVSSPKVIYSNLPPGKFHFRVYAMTSEGVKSSNSVDFPFEILAPFYQRLWFKLLAVLSLIGSGVLIQYIRMRIKARRDSMIKTIRLEEQQKIQERTSEDLHDDLGNKITRISVLADVLQNKLPGGDNENQKLVTQIKENAQSLYLGTKDIIWSLTPGNDNMYDLLERCYAFGTSLFEETEIEFRSSKLTDELKNIRVSLTLSRNLVMIVKEALNNILKHAEAQCAEILVKDIHTTYLSISVIDDGKGMNPGVITGNGLLNMKRRAERIDGQLLISQNNPHGTSITISLKIPLAEG